MSITSIFGRKAAAKANEDKRIPIDKWCDTPPNSPISGPGRYIWDPLEGNTLASAMSLPAISPFATASLDWKETKDSHVFITDLPGVKRDEVKIEVEEEKILKISGQRAKESEEKGDKWHRVERGAEKFLRSVKLPPNASVDRMKAVLENGVLTVTVPKEQESKAQGRFIQITG